MGHSAHQDPFTRDSLPPPGQMPDFLLDQSHLDFPEQINAVSELLDRWIIAGKGANPCLIAPGNAWRPDLAWGPGLAWSYADLAQRVNRIANVLVGVLGMVPGNRVLLRSANSPMLVAIYLAILKAGGVVVATMPLLRAKELVYPIEKAQVSLAFVDHRLLDDLKTAKKSAPCLAKIVCFGDAGGDANSLEAMMQNASPDFVAADTAAQDCCLIGFTSGTTGQPKGTMHNHRDLIAICRCYGEKVLKARETDVFIGSPPLAFTFGLGGLVLFPLHAGASSVLLEKAGPDELLAAIPAYKATICFTAPTAYRAILLKREQITPVPDLSSLRCCVSAGEALPKATFDAFEHATGQQLMDGIGATEMLHIFIGAPKDKIRPGSTGLVVPGYQAKVVDPDGVEMPRGTIGALAVRGPTGCRYLADSRQENYVKNGWNITGDSFIQDRDGYFWYQARSDDMIVSAGYNIAGPEVEASLLAHPCVAECGVVGVSDVERGMIVKAYCVLKPGAEASDDLIKTLQEHVKADIAPYKYPRKIAFVDRLPRTETGKLQRFALRQMANAVSEPKP